MLVASILIASVAAMGVSGCGGDDDGESAKPAPRSAEESPADYPEPQAKQLDRPFTGVAVPNDWLGTWHNAAADIDWQILAASSSECRSLTRGRTTCFAFGAADSSTGASDVLAGGAITVNDRTVIFRMTYRQDSGGPGCFGDDRYTYRYTTESLELLKDDRKHCLWERGEGDAKKFAALERLR
jgi:hypothetical protein